MSFNSTLNFPSNLRNSPNLQWLRPTEIAVSPMFFNERVPRGQHFSRRFHVSGGSETSSAFQAATAALTGFPEAFRMIMPSVDYANEQGFDGTLKFSLFKENGQLISVVVDDKLPVIDKKLIFAQAPGNNFWCPLLEKALAKLLGGYQNLINCPVSLILTHLTGRPCTELSLMVNCLEGNEEIRETLKELFNRQSMICCRERQFKENNFVSHRYLAITGLRAHPKLREVSVRVRSGSTEQKDSERWLEADDFRHAFDALFYVSFL